MRSALLAASLAALSPAFAQTELPLRYAQTGSTWRSVFSMPMRVATKQGFFARHGLKFTMVPIEAGAEESLVALNEDKADVAHVATSFLITAAVLRGADTVAITSEFNNPIYSLVAKPWYKSIPELKGRRIGMADMTGAVSLATLALFAKHGLKKEDLAIRVIEGTSPRYQCLTIDDCEAVPLGQPQDFYALRQGFRILGATNEAVPEFAYTVTAARKPWAQANRETLVRYVRAMRDSFKYIRDPANRAELVTSMKDWWRSSDDSAEMTLDLFFKPEKNVLPMEGEINMKGVEQVMKFLVEGGVLKEPLPPAETFVDLRYLQEGLAR
jgi:ABC-type nitrate/sulfonate/bicarbonate transport system substrate-binding protein